MSKQSQKPNTKNNNKAKQAKPATQPAKKLAHAVQPRATIKGKGLYTIGGEPAGGVIGGALGAAFGHPKIGKAVGETIHRGIKYFTGHGNYKVHNGRLNEMARRGGWHNKSVLIDGRLPEFDNAGMNGRSVIYEEMIGTVMSSTGFTATQFRINPGYYNVFPWLSGQAKGWKTYTLEGMIMQFRSLVGDAAPNTASGEVIMATSYDPADGPFLDSVTALGSDYATSGKVSESFLHLIECDPKVTPEHVSYVRSTPSDINADNRDCEKCVVNVISTGSPANGILLGEIWATYKFTFSDPVLLGEALARTGHFWSNGVQNTNTANTAAFGAWNAFAGSNADGYPGLQTNSALQLRVRLRPGSYYLLMTFDIGGTSNSWNTVWTGSFAASPNLFPMYFINGQDGFTVVSGARSVFCKTFTVNVTGDYFINFSSPASFNPGSFRSDAYIMNLQSGVTMSRLDQLKDDLRAEFRAQLSPETVPASNTLVVKQTITTTGDNTEVEQVHEYDSGTGLSTPTHVDDEKAQELSASTINLLKQVVKRY